MHNHSLSLQMSQIIAADAPLLSPTEACWENPDGFAYYQLPPSPPLSDEPPSPAPPTRMLRAPLSPDVCLPTHQLFDIHRPPTPPSRESSHRPDESAPHHDSDPDHDSRKRSASPSPGATKRRAVAERISSKDFVPPDVSGLSKREARLVKNRAAAFLSRQRKREEFECMEIRVAELEQENARLLSLAGAAPPPADHAEIEQLRARLAAAEERERSLSARLASAAPPVKLEAHEPFLFPRPQQRSGASLGLMVLLCALPSLLSIRSPMPTAFAVPNPFPQASPPFDYPAFVPEYDWAARPDTGMHTIRFAPEDDALADLGELAVSFEASPADARTIRVRIHSPGAELQAPPPPPPAPWDTDPFLGGPFAPDGSLHYDYSPAPHVHHNPYAIQPPPAPQLVFGSGLEMDFGLGGLEFKLASEPQAPPPLRTSQRVRIAMKSPPTAPGEGGEWEVSLC